MRMRSTPTGHVQMATRIVDSLLPDGSKPRKTSYIELEPLCKSLGVSDVSSARMNVEGFLANTPRGLIIRFNEGSSEARRRFTIAHELGHILLAKFQGHAVEDRRRSDGYSSHEESLVDAIAAELLTPTAEVYDLLARSQSHWRAVARISQKFNVSWTAAVRRLLNMPQVIGLWARANRASPESLVLWRAPRVSTLCCGGNHLWKRFYWEPRDGFMDHVPILCEGKSNRVWVSCEMRVMTYMKSQDRFWVLGWEFEDT